ncbi:hypothetical protein [Streptomyces sp. NPDC001123]
MYTSPSSGPMTVVSPSSGPMTVVSPSTEPAVTTGPSTYRRTARAAMRTGTLLARPMVSASL